MVEKNPRGKDLIAEVTPDGCWNVTSHKPDNNGYIQYRRTRVHRYMYEKHHGPIPKDMVVRHKCDNPLCCNPDHFEIGTQADNVLDCILRERNNTKLTHKQVLEISQSTLPTRELASKYNVSRDVIQYIRSGKSHKAIIKNQLPKTKIIRNKLNAEMALEIYTNGLSVQECCEKYNVSKWTVFDIRNGSTWNKITKHKKETK